MEWNLLFALGGMAVGAGLGYWLGRRRRSTQAAATDLSLDLELN